MGWRILVHLLLTLTFVLVNSRNNYHIARAEGVLTMPLRVLCTLTIDTTHLPALLNEAEFFLLCQKCRFFSKELA